MDKFTWKGIINHGCGLTFDDVLIVPSRSAKSRGGLQLRSNLTRGIMIDIPIISSNMDTITRSEMAIAMQKLEAFGIIDRFMTINQEVKEILKVKKHFENVGASIGVNGDYRERAKAIVEAGANIITVDIAHGHSIAMIETIKWLKKEKEFSGIQVIAGNVATINGVKDLIEAGADAIKVGIGPGSMCTTRIVTGCGVPQLSAIAMCSLAARDSGVPIIADGGLRNSGDIVKAFAAGASSVMSGSLFAGIIETPGDIIKIGEKKYKEYRGQASKSAQVCHKGGVPKGMAPEGESTLVPLKGHLDDEDNLPEIIGGIRSGMSYINATKFDDIRRNARFVRMTYAGVIEAHAHGKNNK
jgi:IMP dehydrogenase